MLPEPSSSIYQSPKCFVTYGTLGHVDPSQVSHKGKPWSVIGSLDFVRRVSESLIASDVQKLSHLTAVQIDLILPQEGAERLREKLKGNLPTPSYSRVTMTLGQILERDFFAAYVKTGETKSCKSPYQS